MGKLKTPDWILRGKKAPIKKKKEKHFKIRVCSKCGNDVELVLSNMDSEEESNTGKDWKCVKCKWTGKTPEEKELTEDEFMAYLDKKGEEVA